MNALKVVLSVWGTGFLACFYLLIASGLAVAVFESLQ